MTTSILLNLLCVCILLLISFVTYLWKLTWINEQLGGLVVILMNGFQQRGASSSAFRQVQIRPCLHQRQQDLKQAFRSESTHPTNSANATLTRFLANFGNAPLNVWICFTVSLGECSSAKPSGSTSVGQPNEHSPLHTLTTIFFKNSPALTELNFWLLCLPQFCVALHYFQYPRAWDPPWQ